MNTSINSITEILHEKISEIDQIKDMNFLVEYKIEEMNNMIRTAEKTINKLKQIDFFQEDKRDIYYMDSYNKTITNKFNKSLLSMRKKFSNEAKLQNQYKSAIDSTLKQIIKVNEILTTKNFEHKYIESSNVIKEDPVEVNESITTDMNDNLDIVSKHFTKKFPKSFSLPKLNLAALQQNEHKSKDPVNSFYNRENSNIVNNNNKRMSYNQLPYINIKEFLCNKDFAANKYRIAITERYM